MYDKLHNDEYLLEDHHKKIKAKHTSFCEMGTECLLYYKNKIMEENRVKREPNKMWNTNKLWNAY